MTEANRISRALLSVSDKQGLLEFARGLLAFGVEILSTGGTANALKAAGIPVKDIAEHTGFPEMMDGRLKTLHPKVHGGLLAVRGNAEHQAAAVAHGIAPIDLLVVNLYPFEATVAAGAAFDVAIENIDIGGPAMLRAAAKNHADVTVVVEPDDYTAVITLKQPNTAFLSYLASPFGPKMESPEGLKTNAGSDDAQTYLSSHDLGTGPYMLTTAQTGVKYELTQYDGYWGPKSPFKKVELPVYTDESALELAFDNGTVDTIAAALPSSSLGKYADKDGVSNYFLPTLQGALVTVNPSHDFFKNADARVAFLKSIDQKSLVNQVLGKRSEVATTMYAKGMIPGGGDHQAISFDAAALKAHVDALPAGANKNLVIGYANGNVNAQSMANIVVANLQTVGLNASAQGYDTSTVFGWINNPPSGPDAFVDGNNGPDGGDPYMWGHVFWDAAGGINYFGCESKEVNALLDDGLRTGDMATFVKAGDLYGQTGCFLNLSYNQDWVVAQKWLTGVPESQNIGANELNFSLLGIAS